MISIPCSTDIFLLIHWLSNREKKNTKLKREHDLKRTRTDTKMLARAKSVAMPPTMSEAGLIHGKISD